MNGWQKLCIAAGLVVLLWASWFFRFTMQTGTPGGQGTIPLVYVLDRWTGDMYSASPSLYRKIPDQR